MGFASALLKWVGWHAEISVPNHPKCIICVAPHTSNWDFLIAELAYTAVGRHAGFLMKETWFFWPLGCFFRAIGGIAVPRKNKRGSLTETVIQKIKETDRIQLAITPEGTRKRNPQWRTGFLRIAYETGIPIQIGIIDYKHKTISINHEFTPTDDIEADLATVKAFYKDANALYPDKFTISDQ